MRGTKNLGLLIIGAIVLIFLAWGCGGYNGLVKRDEVVKNKWNDVQSAYQRRTDLIPNLVNTVKGAANFEQTTLTQVVEARAKATSVNVNANDLTDDKIAQFQKAQGELSGALSRLLVTVEQYPQLKATQNFQDLQEQLERTENRINVTRNDFNAAVNNYNTKVRSFPMNMFAGMFGFHVRQGFTAEQGAEKAPQVKF
jgi:LemA protein